MATINPQSAVDYPMSQRFTPDRTTVHFRQFLRGEGRTNFDIPGAHNRQRQPATMLGSRSVASPAR
jgi:hypothetical protein